MTKSVKAEIGQDRAPDSSASTRSLGRRSASTGRTDALFPRSGGLRAQRLEVARGSQSGSRPAAASSPSETLVFRIAGRNQQCRAPVSADACSPMRQAPSTSTVTPWSRDGGAGVQPPPPANHAARSIEECGSSPGTTGGGFVAVPVVLVGATPMRTTVQSPSFGAATQLASGSVACLRLASAMASSCVIVSAYRQTGCRRECKPVARTGCAVAMIDFQHSRAQSGRAR